jgi:hypothetical protein
MKTPMTTCILVVWAALAPNTPAQEVGDEPPRTTGRVLVLENERTVTGEIERDGDRYRIRRESGETHLPAQSVLHLCDTMEEAYQFVRARANLRDADERRRLAKWCHMNGFRPAEAHDGTAGKRPAAASDIKPTPVSTSPLVTPPAPDISSEATAQFVTRVQPILMNACVTCHGSDHGGSFKLVRAVENGIANRRLSQQNLAAVLAQVKRDQWDKSPLLEKAAQVHGNATRPPLRSRAVAPYRHLEDWVRGIGQTKAKPPVAWSGDHATAGGDHATAGGDHATAGGDDATAGEHATARPATAGPATAGPATAGHATAGHATTGWGPDGKPLVRTEPRTKDAMAPAVLPTNPMTDFGSSPKNVDSPTGSKAPQAFADPFDPSRFNQSSQSPNNGKIQSEKSESRNPN